MEFIKAEREKRRRSLSADTQEAGDQIRVAPAASTPPQNLISTRKSARGCGSCELPVLGKLVAALPEAGWRFLSGVDQPHLAVLGEMVYLQVTRDCRKALRQLYLKNLKQLVSIVHGEGLEG
ncbi:unnamed protein product [Clonostachys rosea f. rosea IK726]|uniref:Uncharacterized protein n=1 Tax=Clonostachys rosea f. rosea IK726 TaxID=1349383 RepID=A0ACA9UEH2_BIOOC|nr:unnamed protein product [Clonostachys rosea f. rosea IK726]